MPRLELPRSRYLCNFFQVSTSLYLMTLSYDFSQQVIDRWNRSERCWIEDHQSLQIRSQYRTRQDAIGFITPSRLASSVPVTVATPGMYLVCTASSSSLLTFKETTKMHLFRHFYPGHLCGLWSSCFLLRPLLGHVKNKIGWLID